MEFRLAKPEEVENLVKISKAAFDTDIEVGAISVGGPPDYDNLKWHLDMQKAGNLYIALHEGTIIGCALLFPDEKEKGVIYIGRIFVDPQYYRKGFGMSLMNAIEQLSPNLKIFRLETPVWNVRTNAFYPKCGYAEVFRDQESVYYQKEK